jgi:hypothetical protein
VAATVCSLLLLWVDGWMCRYKEANYSQELRSRTEMEMLLRSCVEDVRKEIARRY